MEWVMIKEGIEISHTFNRPEKRVGRWQLLVDRWCRVTQTIYQFHGCYWHGHDCHLTRNKEGRPKLYNDTHDIPMRTLHGLLETTVIQRNGTLGMQMAADEVHRQWFLNTSQKAAGQKMKNDRNRNSQGGEVR